MEKLQEILFNLLPSRDSALGRIYMLLNRIILALIIIFLLAWWQFSNIAKFLVDENDIKIEVQKYIKENLNKSSKISGNIVFETNPEPVITIEKVTILNEKGDYKPNMSEIGRVKINPSLISLIFGNISFKKIILENFELNIESKRIKDSENQELKSENLQNLDDLILSKKLKVKNLKLNFYRRNLKSNSYHENIIFFSDFEISPNDKSGVGDVIKGAFIDQESSENYIFLLDFTNGFENAGDLKGRIYSDNMELEIKGSADLFQKKADFELFGKIKKFSKFLFTKLGVADEFINILKDDEDAVFSSKVKYINSHLDISEIFASSAFIKLQGNINSSFEKRIKHNLSLNINNFNYADAVKSGKKYSNTKIIKKLRRDFQQRLNDFLLFSVADDTDFEVNIRAGEINYFDKSKGIFNLDVSYIGSKFDLKKLVLTMPGSSGFTMASKINVDQARKTMSGNLALKFTGKNMAALLAGIDLTQNYQKQNKLKKFLIDAKAYLYGKQVHFREINAKIDDNLATGQILIDYSKEFKAQSAFNFNKIELDKFIISKNTKKINIDNSLATRLDVIRYLDSIFDSLTISFSSNNLTKAGEKLDKFSLFAKITPGTIDVKNISFKTKTVGAVKGKVFFDITDFQPEAKFDFKCEKLDFDMIAYNDIEKDNDNYDFDGRWPEDKISFNLLNSFDGTVNLNVDKFKFYHFDFRNLRLNLKTAGGITKINEARLDSFGTKIDIEGEMTNDFPSFNFNIIATNIQMKKFMSDTFRLPSIIGRFNVTGNIGSNGYSFKEMMENLKGNLSVVTRGFSVRGFDLKDFSNALPKIKRIEQAEAAGKYYLNKGSSKFNGISTNVKIENGKMRFDRVPLLNPYLHETKASGTLNISDWNLDINSKMTVISDDRVFVNVPLQATSKTLPETQLNWDYSGIVKYWEDKFYSGRI